MNVQTRRRLIGFLLLLLLVVVLAPVLLRSPEQIRATLNHHIPEPPTAQTPALTPVVDESQQTALKQTLDADQDKVTQAASSAVSSDRPATGEASVPDAPPAQSERDPTPLTAGFTVQVASFSDPANAKALTKRLKDAGYNAYHRRVSQDGNIWQRVFVGPEIKRQDAQTLQQQLADDKRFALAPGLVRSYVP